MREPAAALVVAHRTVGPLQENAYLLTDPAAGRCVLVDPGDEPERLAAMVEASGATLEAVWLTHAHVDHIGGLAGIRRRWDVPVYMHPADARLFAWAEQSADLFGITFEPTAPPERALADGDVLRVGGHAFTVLHTPGHAPGHCVFHGAGQLIAGDLLFAGSIGRTDLPYCDPAAMQRSLARVRDLPPDTVVHPGHGPGTTIAAELQENPFLSGAARVLAR